MSEVGESHMQLSRAIDAYHQGSLGEHHRYRSWELCFRYFQDTGPEALRAERDQAALQLGFYLASWGMYRGSSFLLQRSYTVHRDVITAVTWPQFSCLWTDDFGRRPVDAGQVSLVLQLVDGIRAAYRPFAPTRGGQPTDTLVTKVILGTLGCLPACDRYFQRGFKHRGYPFSRLNEPFVRRVLSFVQTNLDELSDAQRNLRKRSGVRYPLIKLVDMYFWQVGFELEADSA